VITTAAEIAHHARGVVTGSPDAVVTAWAFDSRALDPGACFVALRGRRDGHDFVADAFAAGATVALVSDASAPIEVPNGAALVTVDDVLVRLQELARATRAARPAVRVVGVTGSTGKTSTKDFLAAVLSPLGCYASPASYNNEFGLPITLLNAPIEAHVVVAEMGERFPGDVAALCAIALPSIGVVTNVGLAHAEHLGGPEGAAKTMGELVEALPDGGLAVLNADDPWTPTLAAAAGLSVTVVTVGFAADADYRIDNVELDASLHPSFSLRGRRVTLSLHGEHQVINAAFAFAVAHRGFDLALDRAVEALATVGPARGRLEIDTTRSDITVLDDTYNANPASMDAALRALVRLPTTGRRIAVLGDMRELGIYGDDAHAAVGRRAAELGVDILIGVGDGGRVIAAAAGGGVPEVVTAADADEALRLVADVATGGDSVLVKASRAVGLDVVAARLRGPAS
jgi:UDP-N-acetylmuramoyl-tripeptide--D-alanyl-D-alanine ligase